MHCKPPYDPSRIHDLPQTPAGAGWHFVAESELAGLLERQGDRVLGGTLFGAAPSAPLHRAPWLAVPLPLAGTPASASAEILFSRSPVRTAAHDGIDTACDDEVLFACLEFDERDMPRYEEATRAAYLRAFRLIDRLGYPHLLRIWNYLPDIHRDDDGLERYRRFSLGRHEAFVEAGRSIERDASAASAVGHRGERAAVCLLAGRRRGVPVENPRQVSAWRYPAEHGPRGPTFARALVANQGHASQLFVSGTASITGHESRHEGDPGSQAHETIANLRAVIDEAQARTGFRRDADKAVAFKVYLRHADYRAAVESPLREAFGPQSALLFLQADICRRELLLEIEAVCSGTTKQ
jgi:chorismate lyase / 3-hydroxybenzoate synthase